MKILHLTLKKEYFDLIASGEKIEEYREVKPYWIRRLETKYDYNKFDEIHFKNGYGKNVPFMRVVFINTYERRINSVNTYVIRLGKILEIKNHNNQPATSDNI